MPDASGQDLGAPSHEVPTPAELTTTADRLFDRASAVDPKFLTDRGRALGGDGVGLYTDGNYNSTGRGADVLKVSDEFGFTPLRNAALIIRWREKQENRDLPPGKLTGEYDFEQFVVGKPISNSRIVMDRGAQTIGFLGGQNRDVEQSVAHSLATIARLEAGISAAEQRQSAASQQPKPTNQG
jgi:hypothetical protein